MYFAYYILKEKSFALPRLGSPTVTSIQELGKMHMGKKA